MFTPRVLNTHRVGDAQGTGLRFQGWHRGGLCGGQELPQWPGGKSQRGDQADRGSSV